MLGKRSPQGKLFAASTLLDDKQLANLGIYGRLAREGHRIFKDEDFAAMYCADNGRRSAAPSQLALATLLQYYAGVSDAEVIQRCRYDLRWKAALHLETHDLRAPFAKSTFQGFRSRLVLHEAEGKLFEASVREARDAGLLPSKLRLSLDSSPVRGRGAVKDTYNLLSDAIKGVLRSVAAQQERTPEEVAEAAGLTRHIEAPSIKGSEELDWTDEEQRRGFLARLLADCDAALSLAKDAQYEGEPVKLLEQVISQDVERKAEGEGEGLPEIVQGVAKERVPSVTDPDMRHGRKSSGANYNGHKAHVAVAPSGVVTHVDVDAPSQPEGSKVAEAVEKTRELTGSEIEEVLGDSAYGTSRAVEQAEQAKVQIHSKMPSPPKGMLGPGEFDVSEDRMTARCPQGHESDKRHRSKSDYLHMWSAVQCDGCPLRARCVKPKARFRTLRVGANFHDRRARERFARSTEGKRLLRERVVVEHAIGRLKRRGAGKARYFGRNKTRLQWLLTAAVVNFSLVWGQKEVAVAA
jgi:transposase